VISLLQNDVYEQKKIHFVESLPRLLTAVATLSGQLLNVSALSKKLQMNRNTILQYLSLLERQFLIERVPAWHTNRMKRLIKTPKIHVGDSGLACSLLGIDAHDLKNDPNLLGHLMESFVLQELSRQASTSQKSYKFYHYRDRDNLEVDMIIEMGGFQLVGIKIKTGASIFGSDFTGLRKIKDAHEDRFKCGVLLYDGELCASYGDDIYAVPIRMLWE